MEAWVEEVFEDVRRDVSTWPLWEHSDEARVALLELAKANKQLVDDNCQVREKEHGTREPGTAQRL